MTDWYVHHVNLQAHDVTETARFFRDIIGLEDGTWRYPETVGEIGHTSETIAYFGTANRGLHVVRAIADFAVSNRLSHNPTIGGHLAITVSDIEAVKSRLEDAGVMVSDAGVYAMAGVHQLYCYDPSLNVVEINAVVDEAGGAGPQPGEEHPVRREPGDWYIHHVNLQVHDVAAATAFYRDLLGMKPGHFNMPDSDTRGDFDHSAGGLSVFGPDNRGLHLVRGQPTFHVDNGLMHNPTIGGHVAISVPDLDRVMRRMDAAGHFYSDAGTYAMVGVHQVYTFDPSWNFIEINQQVA